MWHIGLFSHVFVNGTNTWGNIIGVFAKKQKSNSELTVEISVGRFLFDGQTGRVVNPLQIGGNMRRLTISVYHRRSGPTIDTSFLPHILPNFTCCILDLSKNIRRVGTLECTPLRKSHSLYTCLDMWAVCSGFVSDRTCYFQVLSLQTFKTMSSGKFENLLFLRSTPVNLR
jgi:hypothetical protein